MSDDTFSVICRYLAANVSCRHSQATGYRLDLYTVFHRELVLVRPPTNGRTWIQRSCIKRYLWLSRGTGTSSTCRSIPARSSWCCTQRASADACRRSTLMDNDIINCVLRHWPLLYWTVAELWRCWWTLCGYRNHRGRKLFIQCCFSENSRFLTNSI